MGFWDWAEEQEKKKKGTTASTDQSGVVAPLYDDKMPANKNNKAAKQTFVDRYNAPRYDQRSSVDRNNQVQQRILEQKSKEMAAAENTMRMASYPGDYERAYQKYNEAYQNAQKAYQNLWRNSMRMPEKPAQRMPTRSELERTERGARYLEQQAQRDRDQSDRWQAFFEAEKDPTNPVHYDYNAHEAAYQAVLQGQQNAEEAYRQAHEKLRQTQTLLQEHDAARAQQAAADAMADPAFRDKARTGRIKWEQEQAAAKETARGADARTAMAQGALGGDTLSLWRVMQDNANAAGVSREMETLSPDGLTEDQKDIFFALWVENPTLAAQYAALARQEADEAFLQRVADWAGRNPGTRALANFAGSNLSLASGVDPFGEAGQAANRLGQAMISGGAQGLTEQGLFNTGFGAGTIKETTPVVGWLLKGKGLGDLYQLTSSMIQSGETAMFAAMTGGLGAFAGTGLMGSAAGSADYAEQLERGVDQRTATLHATAAGVAEALFEYVSLDKLVNQDVTAGIIKNILTQGGVEASEEICTSIANRLSDGLIMHANGYDSDIDLRRRELMADGLSYEEASARAEWDWVVDVFNDGLGGFLSGGMMTAGNMATDLLPNLSGRLESRAAELAADPTRNLFHNLSGNQRQEARPRGRDFRNYAQLAQGTESRSALQQYAQDNGVEWQDIGGRGDPAATGTENPSATEEKLTNRQARQIGEGAYGVVEHIQQQMEGRSAVQMQQAYEQITEQYGAGIEQAAKLAITRASEAKYTQSASNAAALESMFRGEIDNVTNEAVRDAVQTGYDNARAELSFDEFSRTGTVTEPARQSDANRYGARYGEAVDMRASYATESGETASSEIARIADDGKIVLKNGESRSLGSLQLDADTKDILQRLTQTVQGEEANAMLSLYNEAVRSGKVSDGYSTLAKAMGIYENARRGVSYDASVRNNGMESNEVARQIYDLGRQAAQQYAQVRQGLVDSRRGGFAETGASGRRGSVDLGNIQWDSLTKRQKQQVAVASAFAKALGIDVEFFQSGVKDGRYVGENGSYVDGKLRLDVNAGANYVSDTADGILRAMSHELTHFIEDYAPTLYEDLKGFAFEVLTEKYGQERVNQMLEEKIERSRDGLSREGAESELVADACEMLLSESEVAARLVAENRTLAERIADWLRDFLAKVKEIFGQTQREEAQAIMERVEQASKLWDKALAEAVQAHSEIGSLREIADDVAAVGASAQMAEEAAIQYSDRIDRETLDFLDNQEHVTVYRAMQLIDGKLYPPMAAKVEGKLVEPTEIGEWYQSVERPDLVKNGKFTLNKGNGTSVPAAYNPYFHCSASPLNDQFSSAYKRPNLVVVEGIIPKSELTSGYRAEGAKNSVGETQWHAGPVASKLKGDKARRVFLSRYFQVSRIMSDTEVAKIVANTLQGENVSVPSNVVTPSLLNALKEQGVAVDETGIERFEGQHKRKNSDREYTTMDSNGRELSERQKEYFKESKIRDKYGNLLTLYHGTAADFTVFDLGWSGKNYDGWSEYGSGIYLTPDKKFATYFSESASQRGGKPKLMELYANIKNPFNVNDPVTVDVSEYAKKYKLTEDDVKFLKKSGDRWLAFMREHNEDIYDFLTSHGYDGIWDAYGTHAPTQIVAFTENQVKNSGNKNPTENLDIRYSDRDYSQRSAEQILRELPLDKAHKGEQRQLLKEFKDRQKHIDQLEKQLEQVQHKLQMAGIDTRVANFQTRMEALRTEKARAETARVQQEAAQQQELSDKALQAQIRENEAIARTLKNQIAREKDILAGKLKPVEMQRLLRDARAQAAQEVREQKDARFAAYKETRKATELRRRIKNLSDDMKQAMLRPTERNYVPASLYGSMTKLADALEEFLAPKAGSQAEARYRAMQEQIRRLSAEYRAIQNLDDPVYAAEYDEQIQQEIDEIQNILMDATADEVGTVSMYPTRIRDLSTEDLQKIYNTLRYINYTMKNASQMMSSDRYQSVYEAAQAVVKQQRSLTSYKRVSKAEQAKRARLLDNLSVMRAVEMMSGWDRGAALYQLMHAIEQGTVAADSWVMDYNKSLQALKTGKNEKAYRDALYKKLDYGVKDTDGMDVKMTKLQAIQLLMTAEREAHNEKLVHLQRGGAVIRDNKISQTIEVTPELIDRIRESLTDWDKAYIKAVRAYFARESKEASRVNYQIKHRALETEQYYVPYTVDKNYLDTKLEGESGMTNLWVKTPGSTQQLAQNAGQPVIIDGMDTVMGRHVQDMANYIGLALPVRDFAKVYNARLRNEGGNPLPVKETIFNNYGNKGQHLLTQAIMDVQGATGRANTWQSGMAEHLNGLYSSFVKSALLINPSVTIKQAASYIAAESVLSHRALVAGNRPMFSSTDQGHSVSLIAQLFANPEGKTAQRLYDEIDKYTSMHYQRRQGMSYEELAKIQDSQLLPGAVSRKLGDIGASMEQSKVGHAVRKAGQNLNPVSWIQRMDVATTAALWVAAKEQARMDLKRTGNPSATDGAYWRHVTELYEQTLRETQPMYDGLHRTANQKQPGGLMQYLFPFRTVPIQNHGQVATAYEAFRAARNKSKAEQKAAAKHFAKTVWANTESAVVFSLMTALAAGLKRKTSKYRDEDDEFTLASIGKGIGLDVLQTWVSVLLPMYGTEMYDYIDKLIDAATGKSSWSFDTFSVGVVDLANQLISASETLAKEWGKVARGESESWDGLLDATFKLLMQGGKVAGIPADTIRTYWAGIKGNVEDLREGRLPAFNNEAVDRKAAVNAGRYLKAWQSGDQEKREAVFQEMVANYMENGKSQEDAEKQARAALADAAKDSDLSDEDAVRFLVDTGGWSEDDAYWKVKGWSGVDKYDALKNAIDSGGDITDAVDELTSHGVSSDSVKTNISNHIRDSFNAGAIDLDTAVKELVQYAGKDENDAYWQVQKWQGTAAHADEDEYSFTKYEALYQAIDGNQDPKAAMQEMTSHGVKEDSATNAAKAYIVEKFETGEYTEEKLRNYLSRYCGITKKETVDKIINNAKCYKETGTHYNDLKDAYLDGELAETAAQKALVKYGSMTQTEAQNRTRYWKFTKDYPDADLTEDQVTRYYTVKPDNYGKTMQEAGISMQNYISYIENIKGCKGTDTNGDGKTDSGSKKAQILQEIDKLPLTNDQKDALYYLNGWAKSKLYEAPWR